MRKLALFVGSSAIAFSGSALANPVVVLNVVNVEQFPGTSHVQITRNYSSGGPTTTTVSRDNRSIEISFEVQSGASRDLGSGVAATTLAIGCDCAVPAGRHTYVVASSWALDLNVVAPSAATGTVRLPSAQCDVKCAGIPDPEPATGGTTGVASSTRGGEGGGGSSATGGTSSMATSEVVGNGGTPASGGTSSMATSEVVGNGGSPATGGTKSIAASEVTGNGGSPASGGNKSKTSATGEGSQNGGNDSAGCSVARTDGGLLPIGLLAAFGLLAIRRRK